MTSSNL